MNFDVLAKKITDSYLKSNIDMNTSISKVANEHKFNIEQTKRLIEECNKTCYLQKMAETGEQIFDIADFEKVKQITKQPTVEKKASITFEKTNYDIYDTYVKENLEKTAEATITSNDIDEAIEICKDEKGKHLTKYASLCKKLEYEIPGVNVTDERNLIEFTQNTPFEKIANEIFVEIDEINKYQAIKEKLFEKRAGLMSAVAGTGLKAGGKVVSTVVTHPNRAVLIPMQMAGAAKMGIDKQKQEPQTQLANVSKTAEIEKDAIDAGEAKTFGKILKEYLPYAGILGMVGVGEEVARGMGGMASKMMSNKQLNDSFNTIMQDNKDLAQIPNARGYFDVIARHSPDLARDPMVAPQLMRQFDSFGGVDVNTVGKLREIQNEGKSGRSSGNELFTGKGLITGMATMQKMHKQSVGQFGPEKMTFGKGKSITF